MATKLYVGGLPYTTTQDELQNAFAKAGTVTSANIIMDKMTNRSRGLGFVEMATPELAKEAMEKLNDMELDGRKIRVSEARPQQKREFRPGNGFGGGNRY